MCAVVYDSDIGINYDTKDGKGILSGNLKGDNLGIVAFEVIAVRALSDGSSSSLPGIEVKVGLNPGEVCKGPLDLFKEAPEPVSSSEPFDVIPTEGPPPLTEEQKKCVIAAIGQQAFEEIISGQRSHTPEEEALVDQAGCFQPPPS